MKIRDPDATLRRMGLPPRIALPILAVVAVVFIAIMGYFVKAGLTDSGTALGYGAPAEQGDARIQATAAPVSMVTDPPGTFTVPQTGNGPIAQSSALPGNTVGGGGPPAPVMAELTAMRARIKANPNDLAALVTLAGMYFDAGKFDQAAGYDKRALALDPGNPDVRTDYATALHETGHDLDALAQLDNVLSHRPAFVQALYNRGVVLASIGRRTDAIASFKRFIAVAPNDPRVPDASNTIADLSK
jgi:tetratricopeptide (TPR) repeat protein